MNFATAHISRCDDEKMAWYEITWLNNFYLNGKKFQFECENRYKYVLYFIISRFNFARVDFDRI